MNDAKREAIRNAVGNTGCSVLPACVIFCLLGLILMRVGVDWGRIVAGLGAVVFGVGVSVLVLNYVVFEPKGNLETAEQRDIEIGSFMVTSGSLTVCEPWDRDWKDKARVLSVPPGEYEASATLARYSKTTADVTSILVVNGEVGDARVSERLDLLFSDEAMVFVDSDLAKDEGALRKKGRRVYRVARKGARWEFLRDDAGTPRGILALASGDESYELAVTRGANGAVELRCGVTQLCYEWDFLRQWLISRLRVFLEHADAPDTKEAHQAYRRAVDALPDLESKKLKRISDASVYNIFDEITDTLYYVETEPPSVGDPDPVAIAKAWLQLLEESDDAELVEKEVYRISRDMECHDDPE